MEICLAPGLRKQQATGVPLERRPAAVRADRVRGSALVFDGLIAAPSAACAEPDVNEALAAAQAACVSAGWKVVLALKPLHGLQDEEPKTIAKARQALETWGCLQAAAADMFDD